MRPSWRETALTRELDACSVDQLRQRVLGGDLNSETLRVLADKQDKANKDLMYACREGDTDAVRRLLAEGADIGRVQGEKKTQFTPLILASAYKRLDVVRILLAHDSAAALKIVDGPTPLAAAACPFAGSRLIQGKVHAKSLDLLRLLLAHGAGKDIDARDSMYDQPPIMYVLGDTDEKMEAMRLLLENGADPNVKANSYSDRRLLQEACTSGYSAAAELLLDHGARPDGDADDEATPLYLACFCGWGIYGFLSRLQKTVGLARLLLERGATIDDRTWRHLRMHPPMWRCRDGDYKRLVVPSNAQPLRRLFHKHYSILVRLHVIGTPTTRPGPERWRLAAARDIAPKIASFLVPEPPREAAAFWAQYFPDRDLFFDPYDVDNDPDGVWSELAHYSFCYYLDVQNPDEESRELQWHERELPVDES